MAVTVIVTGQRLEAFGACGRATDFLEPLPAAEWLAAARDRARCLARHCEELDKTAAPRG